MSYTILYDSAFVRLKNNTILPFVLAGCNNVWEANSKRRARDWQMWLPFAGGSKVIKEDYIETMLSDWRQSVIDRNNKWVEEYKDNGGWDVYSDKRFGYFDGVSVYGKSTHTTTWGNVVGFFERGVKNAISFDQFLSISSIRLRVSTWEKKVNDLGLEYEVVYVKDEKHFLSELERFNLVYGLNKISWYIEPGGFYGDRLGKEIRSRFFGDTSLKRICMHKEYKTVDSAYTIMFDGNYFKKRSKRSIYYSYSVPKHKFETLKQAEAKLKSVAKGDDRFSIKQISGPIQIEVKNR